MRPFSYERARTVAEAAQMVAALPDARFIAGGTNLLDLMKLQIEAPGALVDINRLQLDRIEDLPDGGLRIGTLVRNSDLAADCYYFYDPSKPCNKRSPGSGCSALGGFNRNAAVLGTSEHCIASHPSDMAVAMRVLDAQVETVDAHGRKRVIPIADFHRLPGQEPQRDTNLGHGEFITSVVLPPAPAGRQVYRKVRDRASYAFALVSVAAIVDAAGGVVKAARFALGGVAPKPWRVESAEATLANAQGQRDAFGAAADPLLQGAQGHGHNDFKIPLARRVLAAVLAEAAQEPGAAS